jgi:hypothetical protein
LNKDFWIAVCQQNTPNRKEMKMRKRTLGFILFGILFFALAVSFFVAFAIGATSGLALAIAASITLALMIVYLAVCFETISAEEAALKLTLEKPDESRIYTGEWLFIWKPFQKLYKFPKERQRMEFPTGGKLFKVITKRKKQTISDTDSEGKSISSTLVYSEANIEVGIAVYFSWPWYDPEEPEGNSKTNKETVVKNLIRAYINGPDPYDMIAVHKFFEDFVLQTTRKLLGGLSWMECRQGTMGRDPSEKKGGNSINYQMSKKLVDEYGAFAKLGITNKKFLMIGFTEMKLPEDLEKAITQPQIAAYEATKIETLAKADRKKRRLEGLGDSEARDFVFGSIDKRGERGMIYETLLRLSEMAQGTSNTILYGLPPFVADVLRDKVGFDPTPETMGRAVKYLMDLLERLQKGEKLPPEEQKLADELLKNFGRDKKAST